MQHLRNLGEKFSIALPKDKNGYLGRACPKCKKYFKITPGTGLPEANLPCSCPYCGYSSAPQEFNTKAQIEYAKSVVINKVTGALLKDLKSLEFNHKPRGAFGIGISMKVEGRAEPVRRYFELELEEEIVCDSCGLKYTVYGTFAFCPDCRKHNSLQILRKNLAMAMQQIDLSESQSSELAKILLHDALENCVSAFDGFGREACSVFAKHATDPAKAASTSFQNIVGVQRNVLNYFAIDLSLAIPADKWALATIGFQKRHLLAHKMGIVDESYLRSTNDPSSKVGRKVQIDVSEVREMVQIVGHLGEYFIQELERKAGPSSSNIKLLS